MEVYVSSIYIDNFGNVAVGDKIRRFCDVDIATEFIRNQISGMEAAYPGTDWIQYGDGGNPGKCWEVKTDYGTVIYSLHTDIFDNDTCPF